MKSITILNQNEIKFVNGGSASFIAKNEQDTKVIYPNYKTAIAKAVIAIMSVAAIIGIIRIKSCKKTQLIHPPYQDLEDTQSLFVASKNFEIVMYKKLHS